MPESVLELLPLGVAMSGVIPFGVSNPLTSLASVGFSTVSTNPGLSSLGCEVLSTPFSSFDGSGSSLKVEGPGSSSSFSSCSVGCEGCCVGDSSSSFFKGKAVKSEGEESGFEVGGSPLLSVPLVCSLAGGKGGKSCGTEVGMEWAMVAPLVIVGGQSYT